MKALWDKTKAFFKYSETIFWARLQATLGIVAMAVTYADPVLFKPVLGDKFGWFLLANGLATEYLRRRRDEKMK